MAYIPGTPNNDILIDTVGDDVIDAGDGDDTISVTNGQDAVHAGTGDDTLQVAYGAATGSVTFEGPFSRVWEDTGAGTYAGSTRSVNWHDIANLTLTTGAGDDTLGFLPGGDNILDGGGGTDALTGSFASWADSVSISMTDMASLTGQTLNDPGGASLKTSNIERAHSLALTDSDDQFSDFGMHDDTVDGGDGNDLFQIQGGVDTIDGGAHKDTLSVDYGAATGNITFNPGTGSIIVAGDPTRSAQFYNIENLTLKGGSGDDVFGFLNEGTTHLDGGDGVDTITGSFASWVYPVSLSLADTLGPQGTTVSDAINGYELTLKHIDRVSNLTLTDDGDDRFEDFGDHDDTVYGSSGDDTLKVTGGRDSLYGGDDTDSLIIDYSAATGDVSANMGLGRVWENTGSGDYDGSTRRVYWAEMENLTLTTGSGNDLLGFLGDGQNELDGGAGNDALSGTFATWNQQVSVDMQEMATKTTMLADGAGRKLTVDNMERADTLDLTGHDDTFKDFGDHDDGVKGLAGQDQFTVTGGADMIDGGAGTDRLTIDYSTATQAVSADGQQQTAWVDNGFGDYAGATRKVGFSGIEHLIVTTGSGDDRLEGVDGQWNHLDGGAGTDRWDASFLSHGAGLRIDMEQVATNKGVTLSDGSIVKNIERAGQLYLTNHNDTFMDHGVHDSSISFHGGKDKVHLTGGRDEVSGGLGSKDMLTIDWSGLGPVGQTVTKDSSAGWERVWIGNSWDNAAHRVAYQSFESVEILTGPGNNRFNGSYGDDVIYGGAGKDTFKTGWGDDTLHGGAGADKLDGGAGLNDTASYEREAAGARVWLDGSKNGGAAKGDTLINIENLTGSKFADRLTGDGNDNTLWGGKGADMLYGQGGRDNLRGHQGNDTLDGGAGNDILRGDAGDDVLNGGKGTDRAVYGDDANAFVRLNIAKAQVTGHGKDRLISIENLTTGDGNDRLTGTKGANVLTAGDGKDILKGLGGNDTLKGGDGRDKLYGGAAKDLLWGSSGNDVLTGGSGKDTFTYFAGDGRDRITDFDDDVDEIHLDKGLWGGGMTKAQVIATFGSVVAGNAVLDFGGGQVITIEGVTNLNSLLDDLVLF